jgi:hypothetical protein
MIKMGKFLSIAGLLLASASAFAAETPASPGIAFSNTNNRAHTNISKLEPKTLASTAFVLTQQSDVLVQFTSQLGNLSKAGCPCSVRASLVVDNGTPVVVKRTNLSGGSGEGADYVPDRQGSDGSYVFSLPPGRHEVSMIVQQVGGSAETIQAFYANLQALVFPK